MKYKREIIIALALGASVVYGLHLVTERRIESIHQHAARSQTAALVRLFESMKRKHGAYPESHPMPNDPWGRPYEYVIGSDSVRVCSVGGGGRVCAP